MRFILLIVLFVLISYSCENDKKPHIHDALITALLAEDLNYFSDYSHIIIFCRCDDHKIGYLDVSGLNKGFNIPKYNKLGYSKFISDVINLDLEVDSLETYTTFTLNDTITAEYTEMPFDKFLKKLTKGKTSENEYRLVNSLSYNSTLTVLYYFYQNNYYSYFDDIAGFFYSHKGLPLIDKTENYPMFESE